MKGLSECKILAIHSEGDQENGQSQVENTFLPARIKETFHIIDDDQ
jgi:hypothetical protein